MNKDTGITGKCKELFSNEEKDCSADQWFELPAWGYKVYIK
jgi:hypothetical protein